VGLDIVARRQEQNTCVVLSRRWVVECTFACLLDPHLHQSPHGPTPRSMTLFSVS
jgi:hypothetical protein